mmetsp:Transcript_8569/g.28634  ORF Transcript_8569/g.28634 Transcript_8569/m.28634 type:complete len:222 (+) Transcript_8569:2210-2875(+)
MSFARARAASAAAASTAEAANARSACCLASTSSTSSCANRFSNVSHEDAFLAAACFFALSSASSASPRCVAEFPSSTVSFSAYETASAHFASAATALFSKASASLAFAAARANAFTAAFSFSSPSVSNRCDLSNPVLDLSPFVSEPCAVPSKISSSGVPARICSSTSYVLSAFLVFRNSVRAQRAFARCSLDSALAVMDSRCAVSATPRKRSLCVASVSCT